jgi:hypothetical protein
LTPSLFRLVDRHAPLAAAAAIGVALFVFFAGYRFDPALESFAFPHPRPSEYVYFAGFFLARPFATFPTGGPFAQGLAAVLACAAVAICAVVLSGAFRPREDARTFRVAGLLIAFSLLSRGASPSAAFARVWTAR